MRIATITNWAYGITVGLTLASGSAMLMASSADRVERQAVQQRQVFDTLSDEVENDAWALSDLARLYVVKPSPETLEQYQQLQRSDKSIDLRLARLKDNGANREELALADPRVVEYLLGREIAAATAADGWCCVTVDGFPLGGGKVSAGRVKNHYPKALRLL